MMRNHLTHVRIAIIKKTRGRVLVRMWWLGNPLHIVGGNVDWYSHCGKPYEGYSSNIK